MVETAGNVFLGNCYALQPNLIVYSVCMYVNGSSMISCSDLRLITLTSPGKADSRFGWLV